MERRRTISLSATNESEEKKPAVVSKFNEKNYLNVKLAENEESKKIKIRLLPFDKDSNIVFKQAHMHTIQLNEEQRKAFTPKNGKASKWKSYICLEKEPDIDHDTYGKKCPFCEMQRDAYKKKEEAVRIATENGLNPKTDTDVKRWQDISLSCKENPCYMARCIERGAEEDGPKFWKMTKDAYAQIRSIEHNRENESIEDAKEENNGILPSDFEPLNIYDLYEGKDLVITVTKEYDEKGKAKDRPKITITDSSKCTPLSKDEDEIDKWIDDEKVWLDVFVVKDYDYLDIILNGEVPFYDKNNKKWIPRTKTSVVENDETEDIEEKISAAESKYSHTEGEVEDYNDEEPEPEDLPF